MLLYVQSAWSMPRRRARSAHFASEFGSADVVDIGTDQAEQFIRQLALETPRVVNRAGALGVLLLGAMAMRMRSLMVILASGTLLGLAACGSSGSARGSRMNPGAASLYSDALAALKAAQSVRLSGMTTDKGQFIRIDMGFLRSGAVSGSLSGPGAGVSGVSFHLIVTGGAAYVLIDKQFFHRILQRNGLPARACAVFCGKYVKVPAKQFGDFNLKGLIHQVLGSVVKISPAVTSSTINGQQAYRLTDTIKGDHLYVAKNGTHYPIEVTQPGSGVLTFSEWNSVPPISAPPASQIVSIPAGTG